MLVFFLGAGCLSAGSASQPDAHDPYERAFREFNAHRYAEALHDLTVFLTPPLRLRSEKAEALNLRAVVLMRQFDYEAAEAVLERAIDIQPQFANASFNLAEIAFLKRDWPEARRRFETMLSTSSALEPETRQLVGYKIFLTHLLEGNKKAARGVADELTRDGRGPVAYYVRAALAHAEKQPTEARCGSARRRGAFSDSVNELYSESFYEIGWLQRPERADGRASRFFPRRKLPQLPGPKRKVHFQSAEVALEHGDLDAARNFVDSGRRVPTQTARLFEPAGRNFAGAKEDGRG